jgi:lysozyme
VRLTSAKALVEHHEGLRRKPYTDTVGKLTIGYGRNLSDRGISREEADLLLEQDLFSARADARTLSWYRHLNVPRQAVILDMLHNLGSVRFRTFYRMQLALIAQNYPAAAMEMLDSRWARQVGHRARRLATIMRRGEWLSE